LLTIQYPHKPQQWLKTYLAIIHQPIEIESYLNPAKGSRTTATSTTGTVQDRDQQPFANCVPT